MEGGDLPPVPLTSSSQVCMLLQMNLRVIAAQGASLLPTAALKLLETGSSLASLRLHPNVSVTNAVAATYLALLQHPSENVAAEAFSCLRREMEWLSSSLLEKQVAGGASSGSLSEMEMVTLLKFDVLVLLASAYPQVKDEEMVLRGKQRAEQIRLLVLEKFDPFAAPIGWYADLQLSFFQAVRRAACWGLAQARDFTAVALATSSFSECIGTMSRALHPDSGLPVKLDCLDWIADFLHRLISIGNNKLRDSVHVKDALLAKLLATASDKECKVREQVARCCDLLLRADILSASQLHAVATTCLERVGDTDAGLRARYSYLLSAASAAALWIHGWIISSEFEPPWKHIRPSTTIHLRPQQVVCLLNYVSQRQQTLPSGWLQRMMHNCLRQGNENQDETTGTDSFDTIQRWCLSSNAAALWCLIQEVARHCITARFRTHLGGPTQTFAALERMLLDVPQLAQTEGGQRDVQLLPVRLLLELVESLQKNIYNAYEGSVVLSTPAAPSVLFFRANRKVCEEWFARIREALMNASSAISCHFATAHYALLRLQDLRAVAFRELPRAQASDVPPLRAKLQQDMLRVLRSCAVSLCKMRDSDSIMGLQAWACSTLGTLMAEDELQVQRPFGPLGWLNGLSLQSKGEYEKAAAHFEELLQSEEALASIGADGVEFTVARLIENYVALSDWEALDRWLQDLQALRAKHAGKSYAGALTTAGNDMNAIHALARFDSGDAQGACGYLDLTPQNNNELIIDPRQAIQRSELCLLEAMLKKDDAKEEAVHLISVSRAILEEPLLSSVLDGIPDAAGCLIQRLCIDFVENSAGLSEQPKPFHETLAQVIHYPVDDTSQECHSWLKVLRMYKMASPNSELVFELNRQLFRMARKQSNFRLARRLLKQMEEVKQLPELMRYEACLLLSSEGHHEKAVEDLWPVVRSYISGSSAAQEEDVMKAKACLKLSSWLQKKRPATSLLSGDHPDLRLEEVIGAGKKAATVYCTSMGKAWISYALWCYSYARGSLHGNASFNPTVFPEVFDPEFAPCSWSLTDEEVNMVRRIISDCLGEGISEGEAFVRTVTQTMETTAAGPGFEDWDGDSPMALLTSQLRQQLQFLKPSSLSSLLGGLGEVWLNLRKRRVSLFGLAAHGFLKYLSMSSVSSMMSGDSSLTASLYVLRILQNYGVELEETLQHGLTSVPPAPWQEITPQLFACLSSHPEPRVRKQLEKLLQVLSTAYPWAIIYPTLVDLSTSENQRSEELERILNSLVKLHPKLVQDVQLMISELGSITFLWEEQWLTTLQDLHADVTRRLTTLKEETARVTENPTLSHEEKIRINAAKYSAIMAPVVIALERRLALTSKPPETPHEVWFQDQFGNRLKQAIAAFKVPPSEAHALNDAWKTFDAIAASLSSHHKRSAVQLKDVSPRLSALKHSDAPMPGRTLEFGSSSIVTMAGFSDQVTILATKTKPKKISVLGSDGQLYTYLLKGREDLRLDARIMQLLRASNKMFHASSLTRRRRLAIRCYSVTPISGRAGLIQWVDNVTSLYSVYKAWQQRVHAAQAQTNAGQPVVAPPLPRPSDLFYGKIIPALKEKGSRKVGSRRDWPHDVKRKVLLDLMKETPKQLIYKELWCASDGLRGFNTKIKRFAGSVAVMSMIGHILGLGDRHLDNILIDFSSGEVVHIDYNVCFDKGLRLKVPEIVPFRLTHTIQAALGPAGVEGVFRATCEAVLATLQKNKDLILMLLEAFVWDPLLEWMKGDGHDEATIGGEERKGMELAVNLSLFASHVQENRVAMQEHHDQLASTLPVAATALQEWASEFVKFERSSTVSYQINLQKMNAEAAEIASRALLTEASSRLEKAHVAYELQARDFSQAKSLIAEAARDSGKWIDQRNRVLDSLRTGTCSELNKISQSLSSAEAVTLVPAVIACGISLNVLPEPAQARCKDVDREISQWCSARNEALVHAGRSLQAYSLALQRLLPGNYVTTSYVHSWAQLLQLLTTREITPEVLAVAKRQAVETVSRDRGDNDEGIRQKHETLRLHAERLNEELKKLEEDTFELEASTDQDAEQKAKDRLMAIFCRNMQVGKKDDEEVKDIDIEERKSKVVNVLKSAANILYEEAGEKVTALQCPASQHEEQAWCFSELQELVEACVLVSNALNEVQELASSPGSHWDPVSALAQRTVNCTSCLGFVDHLVKQMVGVVLPEATKAALSHDPAVMDAFVTLSDIREAVDTTLAQLVEVELQKSSLAELESTYPEKLAELSRRQAFIESAAAGDRDNLSWEEADELANQEELVREQLDGLHRAWAQRGAQASIVLKMENLLRANLAAAEERFDSLVALDRDDLHLMRGKVLLAAFAKLFSGLESLDKALPKRAQGGEAKDIPLDSSRLEHLWKASNILQDRTFFVWKVCVMDALLDSCVRDASSDLSQSLDQLIMQQKKRLELQLQGLLDLYLRYRVAPEFLDIILDELVCLKNATDDPQHAKKEAEPIRKSVKLLREYIEVHQEVRERRSATSALKIKADEMKLSPQNVQMEMAQLEWLHEASLKAQSGVALEQTSSISCWSRRQILDGIRNSISAISRATEGLQSCEAASRSAEEQLERTMAWACAKSNSTKAGSIPPEFHEQMRRRQQVLWSGKEQATSVMRLCVTVLEFEASREGFLDSQSSATSNDEKSWQQAYQKIISRLEACYLNFTSCDHEWKSAQQTLEAASANLSSNVKELQIISEEADKAAANLQMLYTSLKQTTLKAAAAVSSFCKVMRAHSALTSEGVSMLDEILTLTEGAEDASEAHALAREAITERQKLMVDLKKVHGELVSLDPQLSQAVTVLNSEPHSETSGHAALFSMNAKVKDSLGVLSSPVAGVLSAAQKLHVALVNLARVASVDAVTLHKAFEGVEESQARGHESNSEGLSKPSDAFPASCQNEQPEDPWQDDSWISPPGSLSGDSEVSVLDVSPTQNDSEHPEVQAQNDSILGSQSRDKPGASHTSGEASFSFADADKLQSGGDRQQHSLRAGLSSAQSSAMNRVIRGTAVSVLKGVRTKLEGLDIDDTGRLSVANQVDYLIRQATSVDNLCSMYEGWTPWI